MASRHLDNLRRTGGRLALIGRAACRYHVLRLIEVYGHKGNMSKWLNKLHGAYSSR
jgi:hypothetical protein